MLFIGENYSRRAYALKVKCSTIMYYSEKRDGDLKRINDFVLLINEEREGIHLGF